MTEQGAEEPLQVHAARFLKAVRDEQTSSAKDIVDAHPDVRRYSIHTFCRSSIPAPPADFCFM